MSDIFAPPAAGTARPTAGAPGSTGGEAAARVVDPSPELARLATGESLRGTVVGRDEHGHLQVRTRIGVLTLSVPRTLPVGTEVVLHVRSVGPQVLLNLLPLNAAATGGGTPAADGVQPGSSAAPASGAGAAAASPAAPLPASASDLVQRGQLLRAVLHAPPPLPALAGLPTAQPGSELMVRVLSIGVQSPGPSVVLPPAAGVAVLPGASPLRSSAVAPPAGGAVPGAPGLGSGATPAPGPGPASPAAHRGQPTPPLHGAPVASTAGAALQTAGETAPGLRLAPQQPLAISGHSLAIALQSASAEAANKAAGAAVQGLPGSAAAASSGSDAATGAGAIRLTGLVTAGTSSGQPILHTPLGTLTLDTRAALPPGTSLALEIALPAAAREAALALLPPAWPSIESLEESLFQGLPAAQAEAVARALPQVGPRLASGILFFLAALNQGSVGGWLAHAGGAAGERGEPAGGLVERLGRELAGLARSIETPAGEWRFLNLPLWSEAGLRELRCFFRHQQGGQRGGEGDKATRFVLELELQRHGELQLDGLVRGRLFDLVLRSRRSLPALVRGDLLALFEETNAIAGYSGRLTFQAAQDWLQLLAVRASCQPHEGFRV